MNIGINADNVGKRYTKISEDASTLRSILTLGHARRTEFWAVRHVDLKVGPGETVGILGRNGSGKTTMLKLLSGVTQPSEGRLRVVGRIAPLISIGVGFKAEMSGRDNVRMNGMLLGLTREEVADRLDDIVAFAELWDFIDTPVKFYSSGMFLRLGFAIAVHTEPDVLLVDEVLSVGDTAFINKCSQRLREIQDSGAAVVMVSHSMSSIRSVCERAVLMRAGQIEIDGSPEDAIARYHELISEDAHQDLERVLSDGEHMFIGGVEILERKLIGPTGATSYAHRDRPIELRVKVHLENDIDSPVFGINVAGDSGLVIYHRHSVIGLKYRKFSAGQTIEMGMKFVPRLAGGTYRVTCHILTSDGRAILGYDSKGVLFYLEDLPGMGGTADLGGQVVVDGISLDHVGREFETDRRSLRAADHTEVSPTN